MVEIVKIAAIGITPINWEVFAVGVKKPRARVAEQFHHRKIGLVIAVITGGVVDDRVAGTVGAVVSTPQVAMQQRRPRMVAAEELRQIIGQ